MELEYTDSEKERLSIIERIKLRIEEGTTPEEFTLNDKLLYFLGSGHGMLIGFFDHYATEDGISVYSLYTGFHLSTSIHGEDKLKFEENSKNLILDEELNNEAKALRLQSIEDAKSHSFDNIAFPMVSKVFAKSIALDIKSVTPAPNI